MADREHLPDNPQFASSRERWSEAGLFIPIWQTVAARAGRDLSEVEDFLALPFWRTVEVGPSVAWHAQGVAELARNIGAIGIPRLVIQVRFPHKLLFCENDAVEFDLFDEELRLDEDQRQAVLDWADANESQTVTIG